jgi:hypothetical protein
MMRTSEQVMQAGLITVANFSGQKTPRIRGLCVVAKPTKILEFSQIKPAGS